jgi:trehalose/maltose hydrolase-like predicted phosphorylase
VPGGVSPPEQKARNVDYYERITVRDSSLSAGTQAVMCAEVGHLELAHDYAGEAALVDVRDLHRNTRDGLHLASLAGAWSTIVEGFGGLRERDDFPALAPRLPDGITRLRFRLRHSGLRLLVKPITRWFGSVCGTAPARDYRSTSAARPSRSPRATLWGGPSQR